MGNRTSYIKEQWGYIISYYSINCFLTLFSKLRNWIDMQNDVAAEPMNAAKEKARVAKEKVLSDGGPLFPFQDHDLKAFYNPFLHVIGKRAKGKTKGQHG